MEHYKNVMLLPVAFNSLMAKRGPKSRGPTMSNPTTVGRLDLLSGASRSQAHQRPILSHYGAFYEWFSCPTARSSAVSVRRGIWMVEVFLSWRASITGRVLREIDEMAR
jgi:hypothetical protein